MRVVTFKIEEDVLELVDKIAIEKGLYRSEVIREAVKEFIRRKLLEKESVPVAKVEKIKL